MPKTTPKPTELAITLAALSVRNTVDRWVYADEVRGRLRLFGFACTSQQVAASMTRMCLVDAPWLERREPWGGPWEYRVTRYGRTDVENRIPGVQVRP